MLFNACGNVVISIDGPTFIDIPSDEEATDNPVIPIEDLNAVIPNFNYSVTKEKDSNNKDWYVIRLDLTGVQDPYTKDWIRLYGPGSSKPQNVWLSIDDMPKGFSISNTIDDAHDQVPIDIVFLVDNSTSMSEEAEAIYNDIIHWQEELADKKLDVRFGCVGYGGFVSGAINLTSASQMKEYLGEKSWTSNVNGVWRTRGFGGDDAAALEAAAQDPNYRVVNSSYVYTNWSAPDSYECGVMALRYANDHFTFRQGANRVYVNLTDEPNQPNGKYDLFSTQWVKDNWTTTLGTIHTVYTERASWRNDYQSYLDVNYPWDLSLCTGGTILFTNSDFRDINGKKVGLSDLPVSSAMQNSYIIRFTNIENLFDGNEHSVHITVKSASTEGPVLADRTFGIVFVKP